MLPNKTFLLAISTFLIGGICGASLGINWSVRSLSPLRMHPITQQEAARSYGVGQGTALLNCILLKGKWIAKGNEPTRERTAWHRNAFETRFRSLHWSKYPVEWNYFWQGFNDTVNYYKDVDIHPLSKHNPGTCRQLKPLYY